MYYKCLSKNIGFTLAEVLVTLAIIGIVAEMTIPALMNNFQKQVYVTQLKKFYSEFNQGMKLYELSQDCSDLKCTGIFTGGPNYTEQSDAMHKTFKIISECINTTACQKQIKYLGNSSSELQFQPGYVFMTADGFKVGLTAFSCDNAWGTTIPAKLKDVCGYFLVDVNGDKPPDTYGRDVFGFYIGNDGNLYPRYGVDYAKAVSNTENYQTSTYYWGSYPMSSECGQPTNSIITEATGRGCSARIMEQGWQMNY